jgi:hypothetical protein
MYSGIISDLSHGFPSSLWFVETHAVVVNVQLVSSVEFRKASTLLVSRWNMRTVPHVSPIG